MLSLEWFFKQAKVQKYSYIAQRINADFLCDEENPLIESKEEQELAADIEQDLNEVGYFLKNQDYIVTCPMVSFVSCQSVSNPWDPARHQVLRPTTKKSLSRDIKKFILITVQSSKTHRYEI